MARITVEDCLEHVENRFSLVLIAAERTKQLLRGDPPRVDSTQHNKEAVVALREIAEGLITYREKNPEEVPPEVAAAEVRRAVAARQQAYAHMEPVRPVTPPPGDLEDEDTDAEDMDLDAIDDDFSDDDLDE